MKHKHYEMIVAKSANMDLVVFENDQHGKDEWYTIGDKKLPANHRYNYFLCLPQHKEACLHWLNGGSVLVKDFPGDEHERVVLSIDNHRWHGATVFMASKCEIRIKPKKEKRWIAVLPNGRVSGWHDETTDQLREQYDENAGWQFIEIEVEV